MKKSEKYGVIVNHYKGPLTKDEFLDFYNGIKFEAKQINK